MLRILILLLALALSLAAASVDGIDIHSSTTGKGAKTIILVHGWTCDETTWTSQVPALAKDFRVIALDLPGHGKSGSPKDGKFSMDLFARAVEAVRAEARADKVVLAGHSMGTPVVIQYARLFPQHTAGLVFVDGIVTFDPNAAGKGVPQPQRMAGPEGRQAREQMIRGMFSGSTTPAMQTKILNMMLAPPEATAVGAMTATFDPAIWKQDTLTMPILGIYAANSTMGNRAYMTAHFPAHEYVEIPATGHFLMLEKPEEFNRLLAGFLNKIKY
jgi:pimeloyl-ACP methyl ester carboxylesterase